MNPLIAVASVTITCALAFYTLGVFGERKAGTLCKRHVALFWLGFACDTAGTLMMSAVAAESGTAGMNVHAVTGSIAIALMLVHALWATFVIARGKDRARRIFGKFSIAVWLAWLVPYVCGMLVGIPAIALGSAPALAAAVAVALSAALALHFRAARAR